MDVRWRNSGLVEAGDTVPVTVMTDKPVGMRWGSEYGALYTVMLLDAGTETSKCLFIVSCKYLII